MRKFLVIIAQLLLFTSIANSQSTNSQSPMGVVKEFGLFGIWAIDCSQPPSPENPYANFELTSEGAVEQRDSFGPDYDEMVYRIVEARRVGNFRLAMREVLTTDDRIVLETVALKAAGRIRNWSSRFADGSGTLVEDGLLPSAEGRETGWMTRCDMRRAGDMHFVLRHQHL